MSTSARYVGVHGDGATVGPLPGHISTVNLSSLDQESQSRLMRPCYIVLRLNFCDLTYSPEKQK